jgi:hypothetical protein
MSAFISYQDDNAICMLTDGAAYNHDGVIQRLSRKVTIGKVAKIAVTTRGNALIGEKHQQRFCDIADEGGVDLAIEAFREALPEMASDPENNHFDYLHWHIAAWSETQGLVRYSAHNLPTPFSDGEEPLQLTLVPPGKGYSAATAANMQMYVQCGVTPRNEGESLIGFMERIGANLMEAQRRTPAVLLEGEYSKVPQYLVGGQCDLTIVTKNGMMVKTLRTWPDKIGDKIDPFSEMGNVVAMTRHQRRTLAREQRKANRALRRSA